MSLTNNTDIDKTTFSIFNNTTPILLITSFSIIMLFYIITSAFLKAIQKDRYQGIRFTTKNIAYAAMLISSAVVTTIVISIIIPATVLPPIRIAIEGLMIKISGYMFGPIIGIICATITDLLVMMFVPSYINVVYIFCVILTGFIAGLAGIIKNKLHNYSWVIFVLINAFMLIFGFCMFYGFSTFAGDKLEISKDLKLNKSLVAAIIAAGVFITLIIFYCFLFYLWKTGRKQLLKDILPIILLAVFSEYMITVMIASYADMQFILPEKAKTYGLTMITRVTMVPIKIVLNTTVIYLTWKTVSPLIHIDKSRKPFVKNG